MNRGNEDNFQGDIGSQGLGPSGTPGDEGTPLRLEAQQVIRNRLRDAFAEVRPDAAFEARLRRRLAEAAGRPNMASTRRARPQSWRRRLAPALAVAALVALAAIPLSVFLLQEPAVAAAEEEFAAIHERHVAGCCEDVFVATDPAALAAHLKSQLAYDPGAPAVRPCDKMCGCCVDQVRGQPVGAYLLETPLGRVSLIIAQADPESLRLGGRTEHEGRTVFVCGHGECNIVGTRAGGISYYAVGKMSRDELVGLLSEVVPSAGNSAPAP
jgi:anti-sigma factor RsiW